MSVDPVLTAVAGDAGLDALIADELAQLAADAQALRSLLIEGAVLTARVLPSNGLTDLLEIAGRRVAASLPPNVRPGDVLQVRVTGFDGDRTLLQVVATGADAAVEAPVVPLAPDAGVLVAATIEPAPATPAPAVASGAVPLPATVVPEPAAERSLDVPPPPGSVARPGAAAAFATAASRASIASSRNFEGRPVPPARDAIGLPQAGAPARASVAAPPEPTTIEARLAAARAAVASVNEALGTAAETAARPGPATAQPAVGALHRFVAPPAIGLRSAAPATAAQTAAARASALAAYKEPVALLRALRLAVTPSNVASASLALQRPERLPEVLAMLERALPRASADPNVATLRTLLAFVGRVDPRSPALAAQIAAYVDHVVDGPEPKLATLLAASRAAEPPPDPDDDSSPNAPARVALPPDPPRPLPAAFAAERGAALGADLKQTMLAVAANPATPQSAAAPLAAALTALTAVQVNAAQSLAANPNGVAFTIPLVTPHGTASAQISVKRDAPGPRGGALDPENFRIAFVLETAHYGTVAIDLVTVGREVTVDVRTEAAPAMRAFRAALATLTARLESLRYRVASASASVGTTSTVALEAPPARPADPDAVVDRSA
ncbi:MAG TPA: hypothetical protein VGD01_13590 [Candidatus Elarobacter sp.]|jgi:hypothetical protein